MKLSNKELKIVHVIKTALVKNWSKAGAGAWTFVVKKALVDLGHKLGYKVAVSNKRKLRADYGEWLYDLCWIKNHRIGFTKLGLIAESEWHFESKEDILHDFSKLTIGTADSRLFITTYRENSKTYGENYLKDLVKLCQRTCRRGMGFRYLLVVLPHKNPKDIRVYYWVA